MDSRLAKQIQCSVCLGDYTDPVSLLCDHIFCRQCITGHSQSSARLSLCPECRRPYTMWDLRANRVLRNMVDAVRAHLTERQTHASEASTSRGDPGGAASVLEAPENLVCPDHDERLKLFCETDQRLVCLICRDGDKHQGHRFKPVEEAVEPRKEMLRSPMSFLVKENKELEELVKKQTDEITKTEERSHVISAQISAQFEEMHQFLRKKEEEVKKLLEEEQKNTTEMMQRNRSEIEEKLNESREEEGMLQSVLETDQPDSFLQWWTEKGQNFVEGMKEKESSTRGTSIFSQTTQFKSRVKDLSLIPDSLFLGPYETHLQFFVWKEMLGSIKPVPDRHVMHDCNDPYLRTSSDGHSVTRTSKRGVFFLSKDYRPMARTYRSFQAGQHFWEVEVGAKIDWSVGFDGCYVGEKVTKDISFHLTPDQGYCVKELNKVMYIELASKPRRIGVYLDCDRSQVIFYNADDMSLLHTVKYPSSIPYSLYLSPGAYLDGQNREPITVCWY